MRFHLLAAVIWLASQTPLFAFDIKWPDADIPVPPMVHAFIVTECDSYKGSSEENVQECISGERYGYRAVVMMLTDPVRGDEFADLYRDCRAGLGDLGGRFHRRRAECMSCVVRYVWQFEFMQRASVDGTTVIVERHEQCASCRKSPAAVSMADSG